MKLVSTNLVQSYAELLDRDRRAAAEVAYALAVLCKAAGDKDGAMKYSQESISLFGEFEISTLDEAAPIYESVNGVLMPSLIHAAVVARDLANV